MHPLSLDAHFALATVQHRELCRVRSVAARELVGVWHAVGEVVPVAWERMAPLHWRPALLAGLVRFERDAAGLVAAMVCPLAARLTGLAAGDRPDAGALAGAVARCEAEVRPVLECGPGWELCLVPLDGSGGAVVLGAMARVSEQAALLAG